MVESAATEEPTWQVFDGVWTRPLLAAESALDQVHRMQDGHDELAFGLAFRRSLSAPEFKSRTLGALVQLRYFCPLVASSIETSSSGERLWAFRCADSLGFARDWSERTLTVAHASEAKEYATLLTSKRLYKHQPLLLRDQVFRCHLVLDGEDSPRGLIVHGSHALLDGPGCLSMFKLLLSWILEPAKIPLEELEWGKEGKNLPVGPLSVSGRGVDEWKRDGGEEMLKKVESGLKEGEPPHSLKPARNKITDVGLTHQSSLTMPEAFSTRLIKTAKALGYTITQVFDAAFALATFKLNPPTRPAEAHLTFYPAIVNLRSHIRPLYEGHDVDTFQCVFNTGFPIRLLFKDHIPPNPSDRTRMLSLMEAIRNEYAWYMKNPCLVQLSAMQVRAASSSTSKQWEPANPFWGEITNLGVIERYLPPSQKGMEIEQVVVALRQRNKRPMVHLWSLRGELRLQVQSSDVWDEDYLRTFLEEIVVCAQAIMQESLGR